MDPCNLSSKEIVEYTLNVSNISLDELEMKELHRASSLTVHDNPNTANSNTSTSTNAAATTTNTESESEQVILSEDGTKRFCPNCHRYVNLWSFDRHYGHCMKQFYFCSPCNVVMKVSEREAHDQTMHSDLKCAKCGEMISGGKNTLISHQKYECLQRAIHCAYCNLPFAFIVHEEHEIACGSRTELCPQCNQYIALSLIESHTADVHGFVVDSVFYSKDSIHCKCFEKMFCETVSRKDLEKHLC